MKTLQELVEETINMSEDQAILHIVDYTNSIGSFGFSGNCLEEYVEEDNGKFYCEASNCHGDLSYQDVDREEIEGDTKMEAVEKTYSFIYEQTCNAEAVALGVSKKFIQNSDSRIVVT